MPELSLWGDGDYSETDLMGEVVIEAASRANRTASFVLSGDWGDPLEMVGENVVIELDGTTVFDGYIARVEANTDLQITKVSLNDNSRELISDEFDPDDLKDFIYDALYHREIHGDRGTPSQYLDDLLSTTNQPFWFDPDNWEYVYGYQSGPPELYPVIDGSLTQVRDVHQLIRVMDIKIDYRFSQHWHYGRHISWYGGGSGVSPMLDNPEAKWWPTYNGVESALGSTGCKLIKLTAKGFNVPENTSGLVYSFLGRVGHRWTETHTARMYFRVSVSGGGNWVTENYSIDKSEQADQNWLAFNGEKAITTGVYRAGYSYDQAEMQGIVNTIKALTKRKIEESRAEFVNFETPCNADITIGKPLAAQCRAGTWSGYVESFTHRINLDTGSALTHVVLKMPAALTFDVSEDLSVGVIQDVVGDYRMANIKQDPYVNVTQVGRDDTGYQFEVGALHIDASHRYYWVF